MSRFKNIESALAQTSKELNAKISKDRPSYPEALRTFEERRIDWEEDGIRKAILIQPTFEAQGVNSDLWNFSLVAWKGLGNRRAYHEPLVEKSDFATIETNIKELLTSAKKILLAISEEDLT